MTPQEEGMLNDLVRKVNGTALQEKDPDAEQYLRDSLGRNPDSLYILCQTVLVQNMALEQAQRQLQALQQPQPAKATSFLGGLFGGSRNDPPPPPPQSQYQPVSYGQQYAPPPPMNYQPAPSGQPSFLRSAATTAAGVAAGALAFEGIESMLHGGGGGFGGGEYGGQPREEIVNNYYGSPDQGGGNDYIPGPDEQPQGGYDDTNYDDGGGDFGGGDDTNYV